MMLSEDAYLRRLPRALNLFERLALEGLVGSADLADLALKRLVEHLEEIEAGPVENLPLTTTRALALYAWAVVDNVHNFREFASSLVRSGEHPLALFAEFSAKATKLRNFLDHRTDNLGNLAQRKGPVHPPYGFISFHSKQSTDGQWTVHQIPLGAMEHHQHHFPVLDSMARPSPDKLTHIQLTAFGDQIDLSELIDAMNGCLTTVNDDVAIAVPRSIESEALKANVDPKPLLEERQGAIRLSFQMVEVLDPDRG